MDEFGKGTDAKDGAAILYATIEHILQKCKARCILTTHFLEILAILKEPGIQHSSMSFVCRPSTDEEEGIVLLYKLTNGPSQASYGVFCAKIAGIPMEIISRATEVSALLARGQPIQRLESANQSNKVKFYKTICNMLMEFTETSDPEKFMSDILSKKEH